MNCTKCGKEITEEGKTICDECQNKLLNEIANEEEKEIKSKDDEKEKVKKAEKNKKETKAKKEKSKENNTNKKANKELIIAISIVCVIVIALILLLVLITSSKRVGNEIGNIRNYGYATMSGNKIYYLSPNDESSKVGIYSVDKNGENKKEIFMNDADILSLNVSKDYLYFITILESTDTAYEYNNKICRIKTDGSDFQVINDNEFNDYCYEIYVVKDKVYYIGEDSNIYKMNLDGSNRELVLNNETGYIGITDKYIIYNKLKDGSETDYKTCIVDLDGKNDRDIIENTRLYTINVVKDKIYYTDENLNVHSVNIDGTDDKLILEEEAYNLNVSNNYIFYLNYADIENDDKTICVYRANLDGSDLKVIKKLDSGTSFLDVVGDWVLYMDSTLENGYIKITKNDGSEEKELYNVDFKALYSQYENTTIEEVVTTEETSEE